MSSFTGKIYLTTNLINGKIYVGQSRFNKKGYIGSGKLFKEALKKYGKFNFINVTLIDNILTINELNMWEEFYIKLFNSSNSLIGYNIHTKTNGREFIHSEKSLSKIKERSNQPDNKLRIRQIQNLASKARIGSHHTVDSKLKGIKTRFGKIRVIEIYNNNGELVNTCHFSTEASVLTGVSRSSIGNNLCGLSQSTKLYTFKYKEILQ